jgi:surface protein
MGGMFFGATAFNQYIGNWNTAKVIDMYSMFFKATAFNQDLGNWKIADSNNMRDMLYYCGLNVANYDNTLIGWARQAPPAHIVLGAHGLKYCVGEDARNTLTSTYGWSINGDSLACALSPGLMPKVFPNPTTGPVRITNIKVGDVILLTDAIGQKLLQQLATDETQMLNIHLMAQGIYLISIMRGGKIVITAKITKLN